MRYTHLLSTFSLSCIETRANTQMGTGIGTENDNSPKLKVDLGADTSQVSKQGRFEYGKQQLLEIFVHHRLLPTCYTHYDCSLAHTLILV